MELIVGGDVCAEHERDGVPDRLLQRCCFLLQIHGMREDCQATCGESVDGHVQADDEENFQVPPVQMVRSPLVSSLFVASML